MHQIAMAQWAQDIRNALGTIALYGEKLMTANTRTLILRANAIFLLIASSWGLWADLAGAFLGIGPQGPILGAAPHAAIGFVEAHGLAFISGILLWRAEALRSWHLTAATIHTLLGISNIVFWQIFIAADMLAGGYLTTTLHWTFVTLHMLAASTVSMRVPRTV